MSSIHVHVHDGRINDIYTYDLGIQRGGDGGGRCQCVISAGIRKYVSRASSMQRVGRVGEPLLS